MKKEINITISSKASSGASTLLFYLKNQLYKDGFNIKVNAGPDYADVEHFHKIMSRVSNGSLPLIKENSEIILSTVQMNKEITPPISLEEKADDLWLNYSELIPNDGSCDMFAGEEVVTKETFKKIILELLK